MRSTSLLFAISFFLLLTGCAAKSHVATTAPHSLELKFKKNELCKTLLIQNDRVSYEFSQSGTYDVIPGDYLFVGFCNKAYGTKNAHFLSGEKTTVSFEKGSEFVQYSKYY